MALSDAEVQAAVVLERVRWDSAASGGGSAGGVTDVFTNAGYKIRQDLLACVNDAAGRLAAEQGLTRFDSDPSRVVESFVAAALRLAVLAVNSPSADDTKRLQRARLA